MSGMYLDLLLPQRSTWQTVTIAIQNFKQKYKITYATAAENNFLMGINSTQARS